MMMNESQSAILIPATPDTRGWPQMLARYRVPSPVRSVIELAITAGLGLRKIGATIHPYPTQAEVFRKAADAWRRRKLTPVVKRALKLLFIGVHQSDRLDITVLALGKDHSLR